MPLNISANIKILQLIFGNKPPGPAEHLASLRLFESLKTADGVKDHFLCPSLAQPCPRLNHIHIRNGVNTAATGKPPTRDTVPRGSLSWFLVVQQRWQL